VPPESGFGTGRAAAGRCPVSGSGSRLKAMFRLRLRLPAKALYWLRPAAKGDVPAPAAVK